MPSGPESRGGLTSVDSEDDYQGQEEDLGSTGHVALTVLTGVSLQPTVSSVSAPTALLNREIRDGEDSPTAAQILRLTQNPRRKTTSEMACPDGPHGLCTLMQGTWSVMRRPSDFHHNPLRLCLSGLTKTQEAEECGAHGSASVRQKVQLSKAD